MHETLLSIGEYRVTRDSGLDIDRDTTLVSRVREIVFRGSLASLFSTFRFGAQVEIPDGTQARLYCAGPASVEMCPGTASDPHWKATIEHVGLHSYVHGVSRYAVFRLTPLWSAREIELPKEYPDAAGAGATNVFVAGGTPYLPSGVASDHPCVIHDHLPGYQVRGIMHTPLAITPSHAYITQLLSTIGTPPTSDMVDFSSNAFAGYNWCIGMNPSYTSLSNNTAGKWFVGDITAERVIEPMDGSNAEKIYIVNFALRWLQRKAPV